MGRKGASPGIKTFIVILANDLKKDFRQGTTVKGVPFGDEDQMIIVAAVRGDILILSAVIMTVSLTFSF